MGAGSVSGSNPLSRSKEERTAHARDELAFWREFLAQARAHLSEEAIIRGEAAAALAEDRLAAIAADEPSDCA
jgi:hypothetical protein